MTTIACLVMYISSYSPYRLFFVDMMKINPIEMIGWLIQGVTVTLSLYVLYTGQLAGLLLLVPAVLVDCVLKGPKREAVASAVKILILLQGITVWVVMSNHDSIFTSTDSVLTSTKNIVNPSVDAAFQRLNQKSQHLPLKRQLDTTIPENILAAAGDGDHGDRTLDDVTNRESLQLLKGVYGGSLIPMVNYPDLKYRPREEVQTRLERVFSELPQGGFKPNYKNPCWNFAVEDYPYETVEHKEKIGGETKGIACLPYVYVLGQPKCGTSDLFERMKRHPDVK